MKILHLGDVAVSHRDVSEVARGRLAVALSASPAWRERMLRTRQVVDPVNDLLKLAALFRVEVVRALLFK